MSPEQAPEALLPEAQDPEIFRILVALDATEDSLASLDMATRLAAKLRAELEGLFVEDINLLRMASLSCTRVVSVTTTSGRGLDLPSMERELRRQGRVARDMLAMNAERFSVRWSFRTARGAMASEILAAAADADIVIISKSDRAYPQRLKLGSTARMLSAQSPSAVLIAHHRFIAAEYSPPGAILAAYDDTATSDRALRLAARIAMSERHPITVLILESKRAAPRLQITAEAILAAFGLQPRIRFVSRRDCVRLAKIVHAEHGELFVLGCESPLLRGKSTDNVVENLEIPVLLIRPTEPESQPDQT
jgi:nucleotide-binding universal stress UspA family protein